MKEQGVQIFIYKKNNKLNSANTRFVARARARLTKITLSIPIAPPGGTVKQVKRGFELSPRSSHLVFLSVFFYVSVPFAISFSVASRCEAVRMQFCCRRLVQRLANYSHKIGTHISREV